MNFQFDSLVDEQHLQAMSLNGGVEAITTSLEQYSGVMVVDGGPPPEAPPPPIINNTLAQVGEIRVSPENTLVLPEPVPAWGEPQQIPYMNQI